MDTTSDNRVVIDDAFYYNTTSVFNRLDPKRTQINYLEINKSHDGSKVNDQNDQHDYSSQTNSHKSRKHVNINPSSIPTVRQCDSSIKIIHSPIQQSSHTASSRSSTLYSTFQNTQGMVSVRSNVKSTGDRVCPRIKPNNHLSCSLSCRQV